MTTIANLRKYLDDHPEFRNHLATWIEDFLLDQVETCWTCWFAPMPLVSYLTKRCKEQVQLMALLDLKEQPPIGSEKRALI
jgi:hypothetical protein